MSHLNIYMYMLCQQLKIAHTIKKNNDNNFIFWMDLYELCKDLLFTPFISKSFVLEQRCFFYYYYVRFAHCSQIHYYTIFVYFFVFLWINSSLSKLTNFDNLCNEMNQIHIVIFSFLFCISLDFSFLRDFLFLLNFSFLRDVSFFLDFSLSPSFFYLTASPPFFVWKMLQFRTIF